MIGCNGCSPLQATAPHANSSANSHNRPAFPIQGDLDFKRVARTIALVAAYLCFRWTLFINSIDLGANDFAGLTYLIVEGVLLLVSGGLVLACLTTGIISLFIENRKRLPCIGTGIGVVSLGLMIYGFLK